MDSVKKKIVEIQKKLNDTCSEINFNNRQDKMILLIGDTGSGKSTLLHLIAKDNQTLESIEIARNEYILIDDDGEISEYTIISKTTTPQCVEDITTETFFYDCPGFNDTRDTVTDIANSFSIYKLISHGVEFKIILVINYQSVRHSIDRHSFPGLIRNVTELIKDIKKYKNSIAAVITKVENNNEDDVVISNVRKFFEEVKQTFSVSDENAISLIDILLSKDQKNCERISIFRRPDKSGLVIDIEKLQNSKKTIQKMIKDIHFTKKGDNDFGYTISPDSKNTIFNLATEINENIFCTFKEISQYMQNIYITRETETSDLHEQIDQFIQFENNCLMVIQRLNLNITLSDLLLGNTHLIFPQILLERLNNYDQQINFLEKVMEKDLNIRSMNWIRGFDDLKEYVNHSKEWYILLRDIFKICSTYNIQKIRNNFKVTNLLSLKNGTEFAKILKTIFSAEKENPCNELNINLIENQMNDIKLTKLRKILIYTLDMDIKYITDDLTKVQIVGNYIKLSDIPLKMLVSDKKFIEIFAVNSVFLDKDLNYEGKDQKIVIIAPEWYVINTKTINLNGENGLQHEHSKANDGLVAGANGDDGKHGFPGGEAGQILGIGNYFSNFESLLITANGGNGSSGQSGGHGATGKDGIDPDLPNDNVDVENICSTSNSKGFECHLISKNTSTTQNYLFAPSTINNFKIYGLGGTPGGNGGVGGYGGEAGKKGKINIINIKNVPTRFEFDIVNGEQGQDGIGGSGGVGGTNGKTFFVKHTKNRTNAAKIGKATLHVTAVVANTSAILVPPLGTAYKVGVAVATGATTALNNDILHAESCATVPTNWIKYDELSKGKAADGKPGKMGADLKKENIAVNNEENSNQIDIIPTIEKYKIFIKKNLINCIKENELIEFYVNLDKNAINRIVV